VAQLCAINCYQQPFYTTKNLFSMKKVIFSLLLSLCAAATFGKVLTDSIPPTISCIDGMSINLTPSSSVPVWASDFLAAASDDVTTFFDLEFGLRETGAGSGFPENAGGQPIDVVYINCDMLGNTALELWVRDEAGNTALCNTRVEVFDPSDVCGNGSPVSGTRELSTVQNLQLSPNPVPQGGTLLLQNLTEQSAWTIRVLHLNGQLLVQQSGKGNRFNLSNTALHTGVYLVQVVTTEGRIFAGKMVVDGK
jgi:hypothetical protein